MQVFYGMGSVFPLDTVGHTYDCLGGYVLPSG
jgi:hypothetical protein